MPATPPPPGALTQQDKVIANDWLRSRAPSMKCPICGSNHFQLGDYLITPAFYIQGGISFGSGAYPQVMVICLSCAHTMYFNGMVMRIPSAITPDGLPR